MRTFLLDKYSETNLEKAFQGNPIQGWREYASDWSITNG